MSETDRLAGLIWNLEHYYHFECDGGPLVNCVDWQDLVCRTQAAEAERDKWLATFNRSEQFQSGPTKRAEAAEAERDALRAQLAGAQARNAALAVAELLPSEDGLWLSLQSLSGKRALINLNAGTGYGGIVGQVIDELRAVRATEPAKEDR